MCQAVGPRNMCYKQEEKKKKKKKKRTTGVFEWLCVIG